MKVKMKIKHLFLLLIGLFSLFILTTSFFLPTFQSWAISKQISNGNYEAAKEEILKQLDSNSSNRYDLIKDYMIEPQQTNNRFDVYIGPTMTQFGSISTNRLFSLDESEPYLRKYIKEATPDGYLRRTVEILRQYYVRKANWEQAKEVVTEGLERFPKNHYNYTDLKLMLIELEVAADNEEKARELINELREAADTVYQDVFLQLDLLEAKLLVQKGEKGEAYSFLQKKIEDYAQWHDDLLSDMKEENGYIDEWTGSPYYHELRLLKSNIEPLLAGEEEISVVAGKVVKSNGEPVANAGVFLRGENEVHRSVTEFEKYETVTAADGSFIFEGVLPGNYQIHTGFLFEQIDGWSRPVEMDDWVEVEKGSRIEYPIVLTPLIDTHSPANYETITDDEVTFSWGDFQGASSYSLFGTTEFEGGSSSYQLYSGIKDTKLTVSLEELYGKGGGIVLMGEEQMLEAGSILGFANRDGLFSWYVRAYDKNGKAIGQSNGYRLREETMGDLPFFHLKAREYTEADKLLFKGKIDEALKKFKESVAKNPEDAHSLRMITRLGGLDSNFQITEESLPHWLQLAEIAPNETVLSDIVNHYYKRANWSEFEKWFSRYEHFTEGKIAPYDRLIYAAAFMKQGKLEEAKALFYEIYDETETRRFLGFLLAVELFVEKDWQKAEAAAKIYREKGIFADDWQGAIKELKQKSSIEKVVEALELFFSGDEGQLTAYLKEANDQALSKFIEMLQA